MYVRHSFRRSVRRSRARLPLAASAACLMLAGAGTLSGPSAALANSNAYGPKVTVDPACGTLDRNSFPFTDGFANASHDTFAKGSRRCVSVDWSLPPLPKDQNCRIDFYVPDGHATAGIALELFDTHGHKH